MKERKRLVKEARPGQTVEDRLLEEHLRAVFAAAYPRVEPWEAVQRKVTEVLTQHDARVARCRGWSLWLGWRPTAAAFVAALVLVTLGLTLVRRELGRSSGQPMLSTVGMPPPESWAPQSIPRHLSNDLGRRPVIRDGVPRRPRDADHPPILFPVNRDVRTGVGADRPRCAYPPRRRHDPSVDDLVYVNRDPEGAIHQWERLRPDEWEKIEARVRRDVRVRDDFVTIPFSRLASTSERQVAQAVESYKREAAIVDPRLSHEVNCAFKATALSDLCDQLRSETGIQLSAGSSVTDDKVTLFCEKMPLREVMRQLSRPFGYTWLRSKREGGDYRYELVQDLKSKLLEEELRNRDRNAALIALDREIDRYRPFLDLSPDEALARAKTASPDEKKLLEKLSGSGWGPIQMYFRLTSQQLAAVRAGQEVKFSQQPNPGEQPLPSDVARGVFQCLRGWGLRKSTVLDIGFDGTFDLTQPGSVPLTAAPAARALAVV
jgi:hypothetical protein